MAASDMIPRISSLAPEICPNVLLTGMSFKCIPVRPWPNGAHGHSGMQHPPAILWGLFLVWGVNLLPARYSLKRLIPYTRYSFSMIGYLASARLNFFLAWPTRYNLPFILLQQYSCYSNSRCICYQNKRFFQVTKLK